MRRSFVALVFAAAVFAFALSARAQTQLYNFENDAQGFGPNGFPAPTVQQSTTGATEGTHALQFALGQNQTFLATMVGGPKSCTFHDALNPAASPFTGNIAVTAPGTDGGGY